MIQWSRRASWLAASAVAAALALAVVGCDAPSGVPSVFGPVAATGVPSPSPSVSAIPTGFPTPILSGSPTPTPSVAVTLTLEPSPIVTPGPVATPTAAASSRAPADIQPRFPVRAAFYYPWFPEAWKQQGMNPFTHYQPLLGYYDGSSSSVIASQITAMQYGKIGVGIASWWGRGSRTDGRIPALLSAAARTTFRWSVYHEGEAQGDPSGAELHNDLVYLKDHYGSAPGFFRVDGRFVVFVYADDADQCGMVDRWTTANAGVGAYLVLKVFPGYRSCANQPDGWHQYSPAVSDDAQAGYSYGISPGFWKANESSPRLPRDLARWSESVRSMVASGAPFQLIATFNEWGEGTSIEGATDWASASGFGRFLDVLHADG